MLFLYHFNEILLPGLIQNGITVKWVRFWNVSIHLKTVMCEKVHALQM